MTNPLPTRLFLVDRTPPPSELYGTSKLRRIYAHLSSAKVFIAAHNGSRRPFGRRTDPSTFKVYEGTVTWREVEL